VLLSTGCNIAHPVAHAIAHRNTLAAG
jgi:hypothetical protein